MMCQYCKERRLTSSIGCIAFKANTIKPAMTDEFNDEIHSQHSPLRSFASRDSASR